MLETFESNQLIITDSMTTLDEALASSNITQTQYDNYYPKLDNMLNSVNASITELKRTVGHKPMGTYNDINTMIAESEKTKTEVTTSMSKFALSEDCIRQFSDSCNAVDTAKDLFDSLLSLDFNMDYQSIIDWLDAYYDTFMSSMFDVTSAISTFADSMSFIKDGVKSFVEGVISMTEDITTVLLDSLNPCVTDVITSVAKEKTADELSFINDLKTRDITKTIRDKIYSIKNQFTTI